MKNNTTLITAPGSDIGLSICEHLLEKGSKIIGLGRESSKQSLEEEEIDLDYFIECDYKDHKSVEDAFNQAREITDKLNGFIHLVGGSLLTKPIDQLEISDFQKVLNVNLTTTFIAAQKAYQWMMETGGGNLIFFGSTTGIEPSHGKMPYGVAKAAVHNMTKSFAYEGGQYNIITNTIAPAYVMTPRHVRGIEKKAKQTDQDKEEILGKLRSKNPLHRILETSELLPTVDLLLNTTVIQGQVIRVDLGQVGIQN